MRIKILIALIAMIAFVSCTSRKHLVYLKNIEGEKAPRVHTLKTTEYKISKGDVIYLKILSNNKDVTEMFNPVELGLSSYSDNFNPATAYLKGFSINDSGNINIPIIKSIHVEGLTISEAERKIQAKVDEFLINTVVVVKHLSFHINILGEVSRPGPVEVFQKRINILDALSRAGDIKDNGDKRNIMIIRTVNNIAITYTIDLTNDSILSDEKYQVQPNDIIIVQPLKLQSFRLNTPAISILLSTLSTLLLAINIIRIY
jgi:polysaccharide export outer membrane protein